MTWTNVQISPEEQVLLIKAAAQQKVSVEILASQILSEGIKAKLSGVFLPTSDSETKNPLVGLLPYSYDASPEESPFPSEDWTMEQEQE